MNNTAQQLEQAQTIQVISRDSIPAIFSIIVGDKSHKVGMVKNLSAHGEISKFLGKDSSTSLAWVRLKNGEAHQNHRHDVDSMLIVTQGSARISGEIEREVTEGDIVLIPAHSVHGVTGTGYDGFWGISAQFCGEGLFERAGCERISFVEASSCHTLQHLTTRNDRFYEEFLRNPLFSILGGKKQLTSIQRKTFLDYFQRWSDEFQRMMLLRSAYCDNPQYLALFNEHLRDEFNHNGELAESRSDLERTFDPVFEALCRWFPAKILSIDNDERTTLVHMVIERSAVGFYKYAQPIFGQAKGDHFDKHNELDSIHERMGVDLLKGLAFRDYERLAVIQEQGWAMIGALFSRLAGLIPSQ